jgi:hypothetical protein
MQEGMAGWSEPRYYLSKLEWLLSPLASRLSLWAVVVVRRVWSCWRLGARPGLRAAWPCAGGRRRA